MNITDADVNAMGFNEPDSSENFVLDKNGKAVKEATFEKLVEKLTMAGADPAMLFEFLLTYRSICDSKTLLKAIIQRFTTAEVAGEKSDVVRLRCMNVIKTWSQKHWFDFKKDVNVLVSMLNDFLTEMQTIFPTKAKSLLQQLEKIDSMGTDQGNNEDAPLQTHNPPPIINVTNVTGDLSIWHIDPKEFARQMTIIEYKMWRSIQPWECLGQAWTKKDKEIRAPNICRFIDRFNAVSNWIATIFVTEPDDKERVKLLCRIIDVAWELKELNNFNAVLEVVSGLNSSSVHRLTNTFGSLNRAYNNKFAQLKEMVKRDNNYEALRTGLHNLQPPCIPYLGMYLTDLTFIEDGHQNFTKGGLVNFLKSHQLARVIREIQTYQDVPFDLITIPDVAKFLTNLEYYDEDIIYKCSLWIEPKSGQPKGEMPIEMLPIEERRKLEFDIDWPIGYRFTEKDSATNIKLQQKNGENLIMTATLEKLVQRATYEVFYDTTYLDRFLIVFRRLTNPREFLDLLIMRYMLPKLKSTDPAEIKRYEDTIVTPVRLRVFNVLKTWLDKHYYDFYDDSQLLNQMLDFITSIGKEQMFKSTIDKSKAKYESSLEPEYFQPMEGSIVHFEPQKVAEQLMYLNASLLNKIRPPELLGGISTDENHMGYAINALNLAARTDYEAYLVKTDIMAGASDEQKLEIANKWVEVLKQCNEIRNWHSCKGIADGVDSIKTSFRNVWSQIPEENKKLIRQTRKDYAPSSGYHMLSSKMKRGGSPMVPHIQAVIGEIANHESQYPDFTNNMINYHKFRLCADVVRELVSSQQNKVSIEPDATILGWLTYNVGPVNTDVYKAESAPQTLLPPIAQEGISRFTEILPDKKTILQLIREDPVFRSKIKESIRKQVSSKLQLMSEQHIPSIDEDHMIETHFPGATKKVWRYYDENGWVFGYPNEIAINVLEHGLYVYMYQTKPIVKKADVLNMIRLGQFYSYISSRKQPLKCVFFTHALAEEAKPAATAAQISYILYKAK